MAVKIHEMKYIKYLVQYLDHREHLNVTFFYSKTTVASHCLMYQIQTFVPFKVSLVMAGPCPTCVISSLT